MKTNALPLFYPWLSLSVVLLFSLATTTVTYGFAGGDGSPEDPYQVATIEHLDAVRDHADAHFVQIANIDASETENWDDGAGFDPISFSGVFDGSGYTISNLHVDRPDENGVGLFGSSNEAVFSDIHLLNISIKGGSRVGGIVGSLFKSSIKNSSTSGNNTIVSGMGGEVGGLVGRSNYGTIEFCQSSGSVSGAGIGTGGLVGLNDFYSVINNSHSDADVFSSSWGVGGLVGRSVSPVNKCYATGNVSGGPRTGGLIGSQSLGASVNFSYSTGDVSGSSLIVGGLVGYNDALVNNSHAHGNVTATASTSQVGGFAGQNSGVINNSYSIGTVSGGDEHVGGFVGEERDGEVNNSYWDIDSSGMTMSDGGEGKTTQEMMQQTTFEGWDFEQYWSIDESESYPSFQDFVWERYHVSLLAFDAFDEPIPFVRVYLGNDKTTFQADSFFVTNEDGIAEMILPDYGTYFYDGYFDFHPAFPPDRWFYLGQGSFALDGEDKVVEVRLSLLTFTVQDHAGNAIEDARVSIIQPHVWGDVITNEDGVGVTQSGNGEFEYYVTADGYHPVENEILVVQDEDQEILVVLQSELSSLYTLSYSVGEGGSLTGESNQTVEPGESGTEVTAVPDEGAVFDGWSDGVSTASRTDADVQTDLDVTAFFRSAGGVEIDWYAGHGITPEAGQTWADLDSIDLLGKGMTLAQEFIAGTDPNDPQSRFVSSPPVVEGSGFEIHFEPSLPERRYSLFRSTDLAEWNPVSGMQNVPGGNGPMVDVDPPDSAAFYLIEVSLP